MERRTLLRLLTACAASGALGGCGAIRRPIGTLCQDPSSSGDLTIDVHAHVFNGADLPVKQYLDLVARHNLEYGSLIAQFGGILSFASWLIAPSGDAEERALQELMAAHQHCPTDVSTEAIGAIRQKAYTKAKSELRAAARKRSEERGPAPSGFGAEDSGLAVIEALPETDREFRATTAGNSATGGNQLFAVTFGSAIDFVLEMFQYRYASYARYLSDFQGASGRHIDLVLSAMVDYDWWLNKGAPTETKLPKQVELMAQIAVASGGRLHYWARFCPYREAQFRLDRGSTFSSLALVQRAVREQGAIGVKIYPPMGFAPLGNASLNPSMWRSAQWLGGLAKSDRFGRELDISMRELFDWCVAEDVPILAHANTSSGPSEDFSALAGSGHWETAVAEYRELRVVFGHFGGAENVSTPANAKRFIQIMSRSGAHSSADVSYFEKALDNQAGMESALAALLQPSADPQGVLPKRLLFGSDWKMLLLESHAGEYLKDFDAVFASLAAHPPQGVDLRTLVADALGGNAIASLGLQNTVPKMPSRKRLEGFYAAHRIATPQWMQKADLLAAPRGT